MVYKPCVGEVHACRNDEYRYRLAYYIGSVIVVNSPV